MRIVHVLVGCLLLLLLLGVPQSGFAQKKKKKQVSPPPCAPLSACPEKGCSKPNVLPPDPELNLQKNRTGKPDQYRGYGFAEFVKLNDQAVNSKPRGDWKEAEIHQVGTVENGAGAELTAYLYDATLSDPETCNCYRPEPEGRDFHIWLGRNTKPAKGDFIVVEMTPRIRQQVQGWDLDKLTALKKKRVKVRVRGFLTFDDEHWNFPEKGVRATAWEIHPVTEFEVCPPKTKCAADSDANWVKLEQYKPQ